MTTQVRFGLAAAILVVISLTSPTLARGQRMAHRAGMRPVAPMHARPAGRHVVVSRATGNQRVGAAGRILSSNPSANALDFGHGSSSLQDLSLQGLLNPVPGLGFDYAHLAAINRDLEIKAVIDPATQWRLAVAERLLRDTRGSTPNAGFFLLDGGGEYIVPAEPPPAEQSPQQPPIIIVQQAPPAQPSDAQSAPAAAAPEVASPLPDVGQFTLVLQNGTRIQAVAFTCLNDRIVYITADGGRRTIAASDFDSRATKRINEERGTPLQLPL